MAYSGLETLFQNMGPTYAANVAGQREGIAQSLDQLKAAQDVQDIQTKALANQQSQVMNPLNASYRQGEINRQGAELPGLAAVSQTQQQAATKGAATLPNDIAVAISNGDLTQAKNGLTTLQTANQKAQQILFAYPPGLEGETAYAADQASGKVPKTGRSLQADQAGAQQLAEVTAKLTPAYQEALMRETQQTGRTLEQTQLQGSNSANVAQIGAAGRAAVQNSKNLNAVDVAKLKAAFPQQYAALASQPDSPEKEQAMQSLIQVMQIASPTFGTAINLPALQAGTLARNAPTATLGGVAPVAPVAPARAQNVAPPSAAAEYLKAHPDQRDAFDAKYGKGSAYEVLGH